MNVHVQGAGEEIILTAPPPSRMLLMILMLHGLLFLNAALAFSLLRTLPASSRAFPGFCFFLVLVLLGWLLFRYALRYRNSRQTVRFCREDGGIRIASGGEDPGRVLGCADRLLLRGGISEGKLELVLSAGDEERTLLQYFSSSEAGLQRAESDLHRILHLYGLEQENNGAIYYADWNSLPPALRVKAEKRILLQEGEFFLPAVSSSSLLFIPLVLLLFSALSLGFSFILGWISIFSGAGKTLLTALLCGLLFFAGALAGIVFMRRIAPMMRGLEAIRTGTNREGLYRLEEGWLIVWPGFVHFLPLPIVTGVRVAGYRSFFSAGVRLYYTGWRDGFVDRILECRISSAGLKSPAVRSVLFPPGSEPYKQD